MKNNGNLHTLELSVVFELVKTAVNDGIVHTVAGFDIDNLCEVVTAGCSKESAHLYGELGDFADFTDTGGDVGKPCRFELVRVFVEVIDRKTGAVFKALYGEVKLVLDLVHKLLKIVELAQDRLSLALLGACEIVDTHNLNALIIGAVTDIALLHTELGAALYVGHTEQNGKNLASAERGFVNELKMQEALGCEGAYIVVGCAFNVSLRLVDAREDDFADINACFFADRQLARAANLDLVNGFGQSAEQKGVSLDREAQSYLVAELLTDQRRAGVEGVEVVDVGRRSKL